MKKLVAMLLAAVMICLLVPVMAEESVTGEWYGTMFGAEGKMVLTENGTYTMTIAGSSFDGVYELKDGIVYMDGDSDPAAGFVYNGSSLVNEQFGVTFTRDGSAQGGAFADINPDAPLEAFAGEWVCTYIGMGDQTLNLKSLPKELIAQIGTIPTMTINGTTVALSESEIISSFGGYSFEMTYGEGALTMEKDGAVIRIQILQDGMAVLTLSYAGEEASLWFEPAAAVEQPAA